MTIGRRAFVAATLAGAATAALPAGPASARILPARPDPVLLLLDASAPAAFREGAGSVLPAANLLLAGRSAGDDGAALVDSIAWLAARPGRRMVGLLRDADAVLLEQMTRDGAIRCLSAAQHCQGGEAAVQSRHRITALASNAGLAGALAGQLAATGAAFSVVSERPGGAHGDTFRQDIVAAAAAQGGWEGALGRTLALIAAGHWPEQTPDEPALFTGGAGHSGAGPFALRSFVFAS